MTADTMTTAVPDPALLRVTQLSKSYAMSGIKSFKALNAVSFELRGRRTLGVVGESGCGKSTLARTLMRLTPASGGTVEFAGIDWISPAARPAREQRRWMQIVFQDPYSSLNPKHAIGQILREPLDINRTDMSRAQRDQLVQERLQIEAGRVRQRLAEISRAVAARA